jgi:aspartyl-tRNA(Asn)/glutamyl-tRNA(Gln) amidotransferase subunit A
VNPATLTLSGLRAAYASGDLTPADVLTTLAAEIESRDPAIGGYLSHDLELALADAKSADLSKPLGGVPIAIKDLINVKGHPCSCASKILHGKYTSPYDATVVRKLREAGAIPFGRTNMDESARGRRMRIRGSSPAEIPTIPIGFRAVRPEAPPLSSPPTPLSPPSAPTPAARSVNRPPIAVSSD